MRRGCMEFAVLRRLFRHSDSLAYSPERFCIVTLLHTKRFRWVSLRHARYCFALLHSCQREGGGDASRYMQ